MVLTSCVLRLGVCILSLLVSFSNSATAWSHMIVCLLSPPENSTGDVNYKPRRFIWLIVMEAGKSKTKGPSLMGAFLAVSECRAEHGGTDEENSTPRSPLPTHPLTS